MSVLDFIEKRPFLFGVAFAVCLFAVGISLWVARSSFEAGSFNRLTGNNVSTWDAMFVELRVQETVSTKPKGVP